MFERPFRGSEAVAAGLVTKHQLRGRRFQRIFPDVYLAADLEPDLVQRSRAAYLLGRDRGGVLAGYSAAAVLGADCAPPHAPAALRAPVRVRPHPGLRADRASLDPADLSSADGCRVTSPMRTAWDLARRLPLVDAVVALDTLARAGRFAPGALLERRARAPGARGCRRLDEIVRLSDPRAESPPETRLRVALARAGIPPHVQYPVVDGRGIPLARADAAYPHARLAIEYDGGYHYTRDQAERDRQRDTALALLGWLTLRLTRADLTDLPRTVARIEALLHRRRATAPPSGT